MHDDRSGPDGVLLGAALRGLPLPAVPPGGWQRMQGRLTQRRCRRLGWALAASLLAALALGLLLPVPVNNDAAPAGADAFADAARSNDTDAQLQVLLDESARLETLLAWSGHVWVDSGDSAALDSHLAARLQWLDLQLADAPSDLDWQLPLWSERVLLLRQRTRLAQERVLLADRDYATASDPLLAL
jgi:hypothetical protein